MQKLAHSYVKRSFSAKTPLVPLTTKILPRTLWIRVYGSEVPEGSSSTVRSRAEPYLSSADVHWTTQTSVCSVCCGTGHTVGGPTQPPRSGQLVANTHCLIVNGPWPLMKKYSLLLLFFLHDPAQRGKALLETNRCMEHVKGADVVSIWLAGGAV